MSSHALTAEEPGGGVFERFRQTRGLAVGVVLIVVAGSAIFYELSSSNSGSTSLAAFYYTTDDGQTYFADQKGHYAPFDHDGKPAIRAHLFSNNGKLFVGYLEQYSPEAHRILTTLEEAAKTAKPGDKPPPELMLAQGAEMSGHQVKRPGDKHWVSLTSSQGRAITLLKSPDGASTLQEVFPQD